MPEELEARPSYPEAVESARREGKFFVSNIGIITELLCKKGKKGRVTFKAFSCVDSIILRIIPDMDVPYAAEFPLLRTEAGRALLLSFPEQCAQLARRFKLPGFAMWTRTWRANPDWAKKIAGISGKELEEVNRTAVEEGIKLR